MAIGRSVCTQIDRGTPICDLVLTIQRDAGTSLSESDAGFVIGSATSIYCPDNMQALTRGLTRG